MPEMVDALISLPKHRPDRGAPIDVPPGEPCPRTRPCPAGAHLLPFLLLLPVPPAAPVLPASRSLLSALCISSNTASCVPSVAEPLSQWLLFLGRHVSLAPRVPDAGPAWPPISTPGRNPRLPPPASLAGPTSPLICASPVMSSPHHLATVSSFICASWLATVLSEYHALGSWQRWDWEMSTSTPGRAGYLRTTLRPLACLCIEGTKKAQSPTRLDMLTYSHLQDVSLGWRQVGFCLLCYFRAS